MAIAAVDLTVRVRLPGPCAPVPRLNQGNHSERVVGQPAELVSVGPTGQHAVLIPAEVERVDRDGRRDLLSYLAVAVVGECLFIRQDDQRS